MFDKKLVAGALLYGPRDSLPMLRPWRERPQDQQVEGSLQEGQAIRVILG